MALNSLINMVKDPSPSGVPAHLRVITTSSAHVLFAGNFEKLNSTVCDHACRYHKTLVCIEVLTAPPRFRATSPPP